MFVDPCYDLLSFSICSFSIIAFNFLFYASILTTYASICSISMSLLASFKLYSFSYFFKRFSIWFSSNSLALKEESESVPNLANSCSNSILSLQKESISFYLVLKPLVIFLSTSESRSHSANILFIFWLQELSWCLILEPFALFWQSRTIPV